MECANKLSIYLNYNDAIMGAMASQITSLTIVYATVYSDADQIKHQSSASLAFVRGIHRGPVNSVHKRPVTRKMVPFDDVIMHLWDNICWPHRGHLHFRANYLTWALLWVNIFTKEDNVSYCRIFIMKLNYWIIIKTILYKILKFCNDCYKNK